jgi:biotin transport system substrate-specific component
MDMHGGELSPTRDLVRVVSFAALIAALGLLPPIPVPVIPVPVTAQTLGVMLAGGVLGARRGATAVGLFLLAVAIGFPLLAGGRGGLGVFFAPGAGFLFGWILGAAVVGALMPRGGPAGTVRSTVACMIGGIGGVYSLGVPWMAAATDLTLGQATIASLAFLPGDVVKAVLAAYALRTVRRALPQAFA